MILTNEEINQRNAQFKEIAEELEAFLLEYPEYGLTLSVLGGTVCRCKDSGIRPDNMNYFDAHHHLSSCAYCKNNYELGVQRRLNDLAER